MIRVSVLEHNEETGQFRENVIKEQLSRTTRRKIEFVTVLG